MKEAFNTAIGLFYGAGLIMAIGVAVTVGTLGVNWIAAFFLSTAGGLTFGLIMHAMIVIIASIASK